MTKLTPEYITSVSKYLVADLSHWAGYGIDTVEAFDRYLLEEDYINTYKEANGFKPRGLDLSSISDEELRAAIVVMDEYSSREADLAEKEIQYVMANYEISREDAIRWIDDAYYGEQENYGRAMMDEYANSYSDY